MRIVVVVAARGSGERTQWLMSGCRLLLLHSTCWEYSLISFYPASWGHLHTCGQCQRQRKQQIQNPFQDYTLLAGQNECILSLFLRRTVQKNLKANILRFQLMLVVTARDYFKILPRILSSYKHTSLLVCTCFSDLAFYRSRIKPTL